MNSGNTAFQDPVMYYYTYVGDGLFAVAVGLGLAFIKLRYAITALIAFALQGGIVQALKHLLFSNYDRPYRLWGETDTIRLIEGLEPHLHNSMPSGHTATAFCIFALLALIFRNNYAGALFFAAAFLVGYSRVYLAHHLVIDMFVGSLIGLLVALAVYAFFFSEKRKFNAAGHWMDKPLQDVIRKPNKA